MTNNQGEAASGGPSLVQAHSSSSTTTTTTARHNLNHNHELSHNHNHQHLHLHQRRRLHPPGADDPAPHARSPLSPPTEKLHGREVVIVQTVSVVKFIDASGTVTSVETINSSHAPLVQPTSLDIPAAVTAGLSALGNLLPSVSLSGLLPSTSDGAPSTTPTAPSGTASSQSSSYETLTSTPFSSSSAFPTLSSGIFNSSSSHIPSLFNNHTSALYSNRTRTSSSFHSTFASTLSTSSHSAHLTSLTHLNLPTDVAGGPAGGANDGAGGGAGTVTATYVPVQPTTDSTSGGLTPETRNAVVGGVVGSVAGVALIAFVLLYLLKWKNKRGQGIMLLGDADNTTRGRAFSSGGGGPSSPRNGGRASMAERSGAFAIPAALAKLSSGGGGSKQRALAAPTPPQDQQPPPAQEKGFYRVSGRKLISVLESGGDGYSDPHDSMSSAVSHSHYQYRDSEAFVDANGNPGGLQLGSPMRPVSGVPIFRDGPQRTPVHEYGPLSSPGQRPAAFNHNSSTNTLPVPVPDAALGGGGGGAPRSLTSRDGSRGSASRFTEDT